MATSNPFHQVAQQWNVVTGEVQCLSRTNLVWTLFCEQHYSIPWAQSDDIAGEFLLLRLTTWRMCSYNESGLAGFAHQDRNENFSH